jgi:hypothetical protein
VQIIVAEQIDCDDDGGAALTEICNRCYPDLRRAINLLQSSVRDGRLQQVHDIKSATGIWESYLWNIITNRHDAISEIVRVREICITLTPEEMEDVYRFLYQNGTNLFGDKQITALFVINTGQMRHRTALFPDMILLEVVVRLLMLMNE